MIACFSRDTPAGDDPGTACQTAHDLLGNVCTAGNWPSENEGAAAVVLMSERKARELGLKWRRS